MRRASLLSPGRQAGAAARIGLVFTPWLKSASIQEPRSHNAAPRYPPSVPKAIGVTQEGDPYRMDPDIFLSSSIQVAFSNTNGKHKLHFCLKRVRLFSRWSVCPCRLGRAAVDLQGRWASALCGSRALSLTHCLDDPLHSVPSVWLLSSCPPGSLGL